MAGSAADADWACGYDDVMLAAGVISLIIVILLIPAPAFAWGPVTHVALGMDLLTTLATHIHTLSAALEAFPEVFLYGSLAPDIVQGRRLQSRLRRHSHNWAIGLGLLDAASSHEDRAFAYGYLAHLGADVVAHNFFLPARLIGGFDSRLSGHIYYEARFDCTHDAAYSDLLLKLLDVDFKEVDSMLQRAVDTPFVPFAAHRMIFEGGLKRTRQLYRVLSALGGPAEVDKSDAGLFSETSCKAIAGVFEHHTKAVTCGFDPMGEQALRTAGMVRHNLLRLNRIGPRARNNARQLSQAMVEELRRHLRQIPFTSASS